MRLIVSSRIYWVLLSLAILKFNRANFMSVFCETQTSVWEVLSGTTGKSFEVRLIGFYQSVFLNALLGTIVSFFASLRKKANAMKTKKPTPTHLFRFQEVVHDHSLKLIVKNVSCSSLQYLPKNSSRNSLAAEVLWFESAHQIWWVKFPWRQTLSSVGFYRFIYNG